MKRKKRRTTWRVFNFESVISKTGVALEKIAHTPRMDARGAGAEFFSALDLGTTHVKAVVCRADGGRVEILGQGVVSYAGDSRQDMRKVCDRALVQAEDMTEQSFGKKIVPDRVIVGMPASTISMSSHTVSYSRRDPNEPLTQDELSRMFRSAQRLALRALFDSRGAIRDPMLMSECTATQIEIDGHRANDPIGLRGSELTIHISNTLISASLARAIEKLTDDLQFDPPIMAIQPQAVLIAWAQDIPPDGMGIDVGGRNTTLSLWRGGLLRGILTIPAGGRDITARLGRACKLDENQAESLKFAYARRKLDEGQQEWVRDVIHPQFEKWADLVAKGIAALAGESPAPSNIWLWGGGTMLEDLLEHVRQATRSDELTFTQYPNVRPLDSVECSRIHDRTGLSMGAMGINVYALAAMGTTDIQATPLDRHLREATLDAGRAEQVPVWTPTP